MMNQIVVCCSSLVPYSSRFNVTSLCHLKTCSDEKKTDWNVKTQIKSKSTLGQSGEQTKITKEVYTGAIRGANKNNYAILTAAVRPIIEYVSSSWDTVSKTNLENINKIQNMGGRVTFGQ